ncbi:hypothetical protein ACNFIC_18225 [Pseudomonas sp. NY15463]|uniref:hypothetical protein n=1 Tax=Pseudomonas sp. NY15463 TaxID=3400361 RepID=UPI003A877ADB
MLNLTSVIVYLWIHFFKIRPKTTVLATIALFAVITVIIITALRIDEEKRNQKLMGSDNYQTQINQLNATEKNIQDLLAFVKSQKNSLRETEETLLTLKSEQEKLRPLVETDRATVEAVLRAQEERAGTNIWKERLIGFLLGVFGSIVASIIWMIALILLKKHTKLFKSD